MLFADERTHLCFPIHGIAEPDSRGHLFHPSDEAFEKILLHKNTRSGRADFTLIDKNAEERPIDGGVEACVAKKDVG